MFYVFWLLVGYFNLRRCRLESILGEFEGIWRILLPENFFFLIQDHTRQYGAKNVLNKRNVLELMKKMLQTYVTNVGEFKSLLKKIAGNYLCEIEKRLCCGYRMT